MEKIGVLITIFQPVSLGPVLPKEFFWSCKCSSLYLSICSKETCSSDMARFLQ
jgi:hypothetical protein